MKKPVLLVVLGVLNVSFATLGILSSCWGFASIAITSGQGTPRPSYTAARCLR